MRLPIGVSDFASIIRNKTPANVNYTYIDKTLFIKDIIDDGAQSILITRPRRFGKTLNMSMLQNFSASEVGGVLTKGLFDNLNISKHLDYMKYQGQYPVISVSFKSLDSTTWQELVASFEMLFKNLYLKFEYLLELDNLAQSSKDIMESYGIKKKLTYEQIKNAIPSLIKILHKHYNKKVIVLIDEYDAPIQDGYIKGYYNEIITLMRNMLGIILKDNPYLEKGVLTGITRVSKESIFSGLNNIRVYSVLDDKYSQYFGFTDDEVKSLCPDHIKEVKKWYNGYRFGDQIIYNPWSVINFMDHKFKYQPYWINTSDNALIRECLSSEELPDVRKLICEKSVDFDLDNNIVFTQLGKNSDAFWNLLLMTGYITKSEDSFRIPNKEILSFFEKMILQWLSTEDDFKYFDKFLKDLIAGKLTKVKDKLKNIVMETLSCRDVAEDTQENFYHGLILGLIAGLRNKYLIKSNRESGYGFYDIALIPKDPDKDVGIIIECKVKKNVKIALDQIKDREYIYELKQVGCKNILMYGITFNGKRLDVVMEEIKSGEKQIP